MDIALEGLRSTLPLRARVGGSLAVDIVTYGDRRAVVARIEPGKRRGALARTDSSGLVHAARVAAHCRLPLVLELTSSGADVTEGIVALDGWGRAAAEVAACSGKVPIIGVATGPVISGPALLLGLCDLVAMTKDAVAVISGPSMVRQFTGVDIDLEALGGVAVHARSSGLCAVETDTVLDTVGELLSYLPGDNDSFPPKALCSDPTTRSVENLREIVPGRDNAAYDVRDVIFDIVDDGFSTELWSRWAPQLVTVMARLDGRPVGILANQPAVLAGTLDIAASQKGARFVRFCDAFNLPIVTIVDTPGFLPGKDLEWRGMIRHGAELAFAYAEATVPRICLILRKAFGGAYIVMDSKGLGNDLCFAWPGAEIAVMGAQGAVQILHRSASSEDRLQRESDYKTEFLTPWAASERGYVDAVIDPAMTRSVICDALGGLVAKAEVLVGRKHDSGPM